MGLEEEKEEVELRDGVKIPTSTYTYYSDNDIKEGKKGKKKEKGVVWGHGLLSSMQREDEIKFFNYFPTEEHAQYTYVKYDARGHGNSQLPFPPSPHHFTWQNLSEDMHQIAMKKGYDKYIAGGSSMGCSTAIFTALHYPSSVTALLLVIPPVLWLDRSNRSYKYLHTSLQLIKHKKEGKRYELNKRGGGGSMEEIARSFRPLAGREDLQRKWYGDMDEMMNREITSTLYIGAALSNLPDEDHFATIRHLPCLILAWENDPSHPLSSSLKLHKIFVNSSLSIAKSVDDVTSLWPSLVHSFFSSLSPPPSPSPFSPFNSVITSHSNNIINNDKSNDNNNGDNNDNNKDKVNMEKESAGGRLDRKEEEEEEEEIVEVPDLEKAIFRTDKEERRSFQPFLISFPSSYTESPSTPLPFPSPSPSLPSSSPSSSTSLSPPSSPLFFDPFSLPRKQYCK